MSLAMSVGMLRKSALAKWISVASVGSWWSAEVPGSGPAPSAKSPQCVEYVGDEGMSTVEYAVGTIAAAAFGAVLYKIVTGDSVLSGLTSLINSALNTSL